MKGFSKIALFVIILAILAAAAGYFGYQRFYKTIPSCEDVGISPEEIGRVVVEAYASGKYNDAGSGPEPWKELFEYIEKELGCTLEKAPDKNAIDISNLVQSGIEGWKTYRNEKYGFEVRYPPDWTIDDGRLALEAALIVLYDKQDNQIYINLLPRGEEEESTDIDCPFSTHEVECKKLLNDSGIEYIREISTGQLELSNQQELNAYMKSTKTDIQVSTILTDKNGKPFLSKDKDLIVAIFDQILSTLKFID